MHISTQPMDLKGYKAIIPGVSYGNVGQLAVDLLIATTKAKKIGTIWSEGVLPFVGSPAFDHLPSDLTVSTEIFASESDKFIFIQIRSPILQLFENEFRDTLLQWMINAGIELLVILTSGLDMKKYRSQVDDPDSVRYIVGEHVDSNIKEQLKSLQCLEIKNEETEDLNDQGTRLSMSFLSSSNSMDLPCLLLLRYCTGEGDTRPYAISVASFLDEMFNLFQQKDNSERYFLTPSYWEMMFGNDPPENLY